MVAEAVAAAVVVDHLHQAAVEVALEGERAALLVGGLLLLAVAVAELDQAAGSVEARHVVVAADQAEAAARVLLERQVEAGRADVGALGAARLVRPGHGVEGAAAAAFGALQVEAPDVAAAVVVLDLAGGRDLAQVGEERAAPAGRAERAEAGGAGAVGALGDESERAAGHGVVGGGEQALARDQRGREPELAGRPGGGALDRLGQRGLSRRRHHVGPRRDAGEGGRWAVVVTLGGEKGERLGGGGGGRRGDVTAAGLVVGVAGWYEGGALFVVDGVEEDAQVGAGGQQLLDRLESGIAAGRVR